jgi:hypothetical protein
MVALAALLAVAVSAIAASTAGAVHLSADAYGLTDGNRLVRFGTGAPGEIDANVKVSGLPAGAELIGIDVRPLDGKLYTVARVGTTGRLYTLAPETGAATFVATLVAPGTTTPIALQGTRFGFDFNPAADALRIVSDQGQNLRALPSSRAAGAVGTTFTDGALNDAGTTAVGIAGAAYTNNDNDPATGTVLYDIDARVDGLAIQNPPNAGTLMRVGPLGVDTEDAVGFDIRTVGAANIAYASLAQQRGHGATLATLYQVDLESGAVTPLGKIGGPKTLIDIAVAP